ncbi:MAG: Gldg family protein [Planctomycetota bacterium]|jgi:ABC-type uncharacterized transport system involved in gliding motility auxiliary subunit
MNQKTQRRQTFLRFVLENVLLRTALLLGTVYFFGASLQGAVMRKDLTEDKRFTISAASHRMAGELEDQLTIRAYFTEKLSESLVPIHRQVLDILEEYQAASGGKIKIERFDPDTNSIAKNEAEGYGIQPAELVIPEATGQKYVRVYGSIVLLYRDRQSEVLNIARRYPEGYRGLSGLEYELSSRLWQLSHEKPKLGITGHLSNMPAPNPMNPMGGGRPQPMFQGLRRLLGDAFEIADVDLSQAEPDPEKMPCLLVVRPKELNDIAQFRLDQYLMKGGRVILFVTQGERAANPMTRGEQLRMFKTGLEDWLEYQGIRVPPELVMHYRASLPMPVRMEVAPGVVQDVAVPNPFLPMISREMEGCLDPTNPAIQSLRDVFFLWPHPVEVLEGRKSADVNATVLVRSSEKESWRWKDMSRIGHRQVLIGIRNGTDMPTDTYSSPIIVALDGEFTSFYADPKANPVPASLAGGEDEKEGTDSPGDEDAEKTEEKKAPDVIKKSKPTQLVVVGNALFVSDLILGGNRVSDRAKQAAQVAFNLVDWLARSADLAAMRNKTLESRDLVDTVKDALPDLIAELKEGKISREEFRERLTATKDEQKAERKSWRWKNILLPPLAVLVAGLIVWIVRVGVRGTVSGTPEAEPPEDWDRLVNVDEMGDPGSDEIGLPTSGDDS